MLRALPTQASQIAYYTCAHMMSCQLAHNGCTCQGASCYRCDRPRCVRKLQGTEKHHSWCDSCCKVYSATKNDRQKRQKVASFATQQEGVPSDPPPTIVLQHNATGKHAAEAPATSAASLNGATVTIEVGRCVASDRDAGKRRVARRCSVVQAVLHRIRGQSTCICCLAMLPRDHVAG
jgi:hypothetical protein